MFLQDDVVKALALTGQTLMGQSIMVKSSEVRLQQLCIAPLSQISPMSHALHIHILFAVR